MQICLLNGVRVLVDFWFNALYNLHSVITYTVFFLLCTSSPSSAFSPYFLFYSLMLLLFIFLLLLMFPLLCSKILASCYFFKFCSPTLEQEQDQHSQGEVRLKMYCFVPEHCGIKKELWRSSHLCQQGSSWIFQYLPIWLRKQHFNIYFLFLC